VKLIRNFLLVGVLFATGAFANNLLTNGSFELGSFVDNGHGGDALSVGSTFGSPLTTTGWTVTTAALFWLNNSGYYSATPEAGSYFVDLAYANPFAGVSQVVNLAAGSYALTFYLGSYVGTTAPNGAGPVYLTASASENSQTLATNSSFSSPSGGSGNVWGQQTLNFSVATAGNVTINLVGTYAQNHTYLGLDNVDLEYLGTSAPEPAMILPLAFAGALFVLGRRKRARP
jgi:hypothetical protein